MTPERMAALHARCFPDRPWSAQEIDDLLRSGTVQSFASPDGAGWLLTRVVPPEAELLTLAVCPDARRRGVASSLMTRWIEAMAQQGITDLHLEVADDNAAAIALYDRCKFAQNGRRRGYYSRQDGAHVDALLMHRSVT